MFVFKIIVMSYLIGELRKNISKDTNIHHIIAGAVIDCFCLKNRVRDQLSIYGARLSTPSLLEVVQ